jgi:8-oxo-dGTP pyrophosphatase MutT (NUDIX family)
MIRRPAHMRRNANDVAFPGGMLEPGDADLAATALRETEEELGIAASAVTIVGRLDGVHVLRHDVEIAPYVGIVREGTPVVPDASEIAAVYEIPLRALFEPNAVHEAMKAIADFSVRTWVFDYDDVHVWGASARILHDFTRAYPTRFREALEPH